MTTQNCPECGTPAEPGQAFCDACGAVLSWTDRTDRTPARASTAAAADTGTSSPPREPAPAPTAAPTPAAPTPAPTAARPADDDHDDHDSDDEDTTETPLPAIPPEDPATPTPAPAPTSAPTPAPAQAAAAPTAPPAPAAPTADDDEAMAARARSLLVPVADTEPRPTPPPSVAPVLPGRPVADRPQVRAPGPVQGEMHGVACPWCATPNNPDRHYCMRCAMPMTLEDRSTLRLPWWRRLFNRNGETPWAGDRPRLRRTFDRIVTWVVAAVVLTLVILAAVNTPAAIQATKDHFAKRAPVFADSYAASRSYPGHKPELAFDRINNTWWGPGVSESGAGEWIEARFDEPIRLLDVVITSGTTTRPDQFTQSALPHRIKATITLKDGKITTREITLDQSAGGQPRSFRVGDVSKVRFTIESSFLASGSKQVAIAEIEFFGRSSANST
ncbi:zinc ribbon domain-containing protein [Streptomyces sp. NPDC050263]|uniref:zinc ribbon domain-containing protein n=1 Tax=Streptomyces sp. NPDC050263 TaxID=3155037 RepID=UPI00343E63B7